MVTEINRLYLRFGVRKVKTINIWMMDLDIRILYCVFPPNLKSGCTRHKNLYGFSVLIKTYSNVGDTVLDNCMGHGTTGIAAIELARDFIGMEMDKEYFEKAKRKIQMAETRIQLELNFES
ncbi:DNA methylase domain protein [Leptospira alstonii serovar Pingchang str. 80-412]|uniref:DNA methylase domain protein n=1 Tax=Leptospira alstonii serovar Pingchang str. 80-412 TaxID=1218564 RepID=T0H5D4_9LEPT|nr:DNA methylase domain protein [Leptospira alstonii serovar Pingchang str. 80-412]